MGQGIYSKAITDALSTRGAWSDVMVGKTIAHYEIIEKLGEGWQSRAQLGAFSKRRRCLDEDLT